MITITKDYNYTCPYDLNRLMDPERLLFFDIETTGLSAKRDLVYLIGCVYFRDGGWHLRQWFSDSAEAEKEVLLHFFLFASRFSMMIHFNGTTFDLPFLKERASKHRLTLPSREPESFDLYRKLRPMKQLLGLSDCKQKTLETFLGTGREDPYNGGELIRFYWDYLQTGEKRFYDALLLHNAEDIMGLPELFTLFHYKDFFSGPFTLCSEQVQEYLTLSGSTEQELFLTFEHPSITLPVPFTYGADELRISCRKNRLVLRLPLEHMTLRYFFPDYKNYYYLPEEDQAIHKSVAVFVDPAHKKKATAKTCYQNRTGVFFPIPDLSGSLPPLFYREYKKKPAYLEYTPGIGENATLFQTILLAKLPFS